MIIAFFSNVLNTHQVALCDELYHLNDSRFYFIQTGILNEARKTMGFKQYERPYLISAIDEDMEACRIAQSADVAIMGAESFKYLKLRLCKTDGLTFSYSERWLKRGLINILSPNLLKQLALYIAKGHRKRWYMLASSGFLSEDLRKLRIFKNRVYKWGYFPKYENPDRILPSHTTTDTNKARILWVASFIPLKRPELMIKLSEMLASNNYDFELTMIGGGQMLQEISEMVNKNQLIKDKVFLPGYISNKEVLSKMIESDIFCFTSTRLEGWGAVVGEAMSTGCCPVVSSDVGSGPFLIKDTLNGLTFKSGDIDDLYRKVTFLIDNPEKKKLMSETAKKTILEEWNAATAAQEFIKLAKIKLVNGNATTEDSSLPASPARPIRH